MGKATRWLDQKFYPGIASNWDDGVLREWVLREVGPHSHLLDLGAGAGIVPQMNFRDHVERVCGVDPDPRVAENPYLHEAKVGFGENIPYGEAEFDIVVADNVLEHLDRPVDVFLEVNRVLKPGGLFMAKTPNRRHYMPLAARLMPLSVHKMFNKRRGRDPDDTFPTLYRANSRRALESIAAQSNFEIVEIGFYESRPEYLRFTPLTYVGGILYERIANRFSWFEAFRIVLIMKLRKRDSGCMPA